MDAPIGVFDSGVGGLTVLRALLARLPHEHTIYLGDTARVPYGTRSREVVTRYALLCARYLAAQGIKMLVVACNTVSADSLPVLAQTLPIPVVGVIAQAMGPTPTLVDSAQATAEAVAQVLEARSIDRRDGAARHRTLCTDVPDRFHRMAERFLGRPLDRIEAVDLAEGA